MVRQTDGIVQRAFIIGIGQVAATAQCRTKTTAMNSNHRLEPGNRVDAEVKRLDMSALHESKHNDLALEQLRVTPV